MAERIQLKEPGSEIVMFVTSAKAETVEKNDYYLFSNGKKEMLVPQSSVDNQLERMGVKFVENLIGKHVKFARSMKMSRANKPYWDVSIASGAEAEHQALSQAGVQSAGGEMGKPGNSASAPPAEPASKKPTIREAYKQLTQWVIDEVAPIYAEEEWALTSSDIAAITATLFIQACKTGKVE